MGPDENKALIRRWLQMGERGFSGDFGEFFAPDYVGHLGGQAPQTLDDLVRLERGFAASFANISYQAAAGAALSAAGCYDRRRLTAIIPRPESSSGRAAGRGTGVRDSSFQ